MVEQVLCHPGTLCLPVQPKTARAMVDMIAAEDNVDGGVHFNSADFCAGQILLVIDIMNMVIFYNGKNAAKMSDNTGLSAVMDMAAASDMGTDMFFIPAFIGSLADAVTFMLSLLGCRYLPREIPEHLDS